MTEPANAAELFTPCEECAAETRGLILGAVVAGAVLGAVAAYFILKK
jgi:hypothetical protein